MLRKIIASQLAFLFVLGNTFAFVGAEEEPEQPETIEDTVQEEAEESEEEFVEESLDEDSSESVVEEIVEQEPSEESEEVKPADSDIEDSDEVSEEQIEYSITVEEENYLIDYGVATEYDGLDISIRSNCVAFARYKVPSLPSGLGDMNGKKAIINSYSPVAGCIAITSGNSSLGHVAYVEAVNGNTITTLNGGFSGKIWGTDYTNRIIRMTGTPSELGVIGYWVPGTPPVPASINFSSISINSNDPNNTVFSFHADGLGSGTWTAAGVAFHRVGHSEEYMERGDSFSIGSSYINSTISLGSEHGIKLQPGTDYQYRFYATFNGTLYWSDVYTFKTSGQSNELVLHDAGNDFYGYIVEQSNWKHIYVDSVFPSKWGVKVVYNLVNDDHSPAEIFHFVRQSNGSYLISSAYWEGHENTSWYLTCEDSGRARGSEIILAKYNGSSTQRWAIYRTPDYSRSVVVSEGSDMALAIGYNDTLSYTQQTRLILDSKSIIKNQKMWFYDMAKDGRTYQKPGKPAASTYTGPTTFIANGKSSTVSWTESPLVNYFDKRSYQLLLFDEEGNKRLSYIGLSGNSSKLSLDKDRYPGGVYYIQIRAINSYYGSPDNETNWSGAPKLTTTLYTDGPKTRVIVYNEDGSLPATGVSLNKTTLTLIEGKSSSLTATVSPAEATDKTITWTTSDKNVATVSNGKITAVKAGTATITAKSNNGKTATCKVTVNPKTVAVTGIKLNKTATELVTKKTLQLTATVSPADATNKDVTWTSSNTKVATVDSNGKVTAKTYGKTTITATSVSNPSIKKTCTIQTRFYDVNDSSQYYYTPVYWGTDNNVVVGFESGVYFGPQESCTRAQFVTFLWRLAGKPTASGTKVTFKDIKGTENYFKAIQWAVSEKIIGGYVVDNTFRPDNTVDRVSVAIMLWKYAGRPNVNISGKSPFKDISATNTPTLNSYKAVVWGYNNKIIKGYSDGTFKPFANCLREHIVTFLYRYETN